MLPVVTKRAQSLLRHIVPPRAGARIELALLVLHPVLFPLAILNILSFCVLGPGFGMFECVYVCAYVYVFPYLSYFFSPLLLIQ